MADNGPTSYSTADAGFTLFEVIAVLVIAAVVASAVIFANRSNGSAAQLTAVAANVAAGLRHSRGHAIRTGREIVAKIDTSGGRIAWGTRRKSLDLGTVRVEVVSAESERRGRVAGIRFFPNGSSTGGRLKLSSNAGRIEIGINWLTGTISVEEAG